MPPLHESAAALLPGDEALPPLHHQPQSRIALAAGGIKPSRGLSLLAASVNWTADRVTAGLCLAPPCARGGRRFRLRRLREVCSLPPASRWIWGARSAPVMSSARLLEKVRFDQVGFATRPGWEELDMIATLL